MVSYHTRSLSQALAGLGFKFKGLGALGLMGGYKVSPGVGSRSQGGYLGHCSQSPGGKCEVSMGTQVAPDLPVSQGQSHRKPHLLTFDFPSRILGEAFRMPQGRSSIPELLLSIQADVGNPHPGLDRQPGQQ